MGPCPHWEKQPALLTRTSTWRPAVATPVRSVFTYFSTSPWTGQLSPTVHTKTCRSYGPTPRTVPLEESDPFEVVVEREHHEQHEEREPHLLSHLSLPDGQRPAQHRLAGEEQEVPAVEHRHRQEGQQEQVDADHRGEQGQARDALARLLA